MKHLEFGPVSEVAVSVMRHEGMTTTAEPHKGDTTESLQDGNTLQRLCLAAGSGACAQTCQLSGETKVAAESMCAENNIDMALEEFGVPTESFVMVSTSGNRVAYGDELPKDTFVTEQGYAQIPNTNALFYRPGVDELPTGEKALASAMRLGDSGSVHMRMYDSEGRLVLGQAHFTRTNMHGDSAFTDDLDDEKVSWAESIIGNAIQHYGANPETIRIEVSAAIKGEDFRHVFPTIEKMRDKFAGWEELGFMDYTIDEEGRVHVDPAYREMIDWQIARASDRFNLTDEQIVSDEAINTGNPFTGHASYQVSKNGNVIDGRDMYITGINQASLAREIEEASVEMRDMWSSSDSANALSEFEEADEFTGKGRWLQRHIDNLKGMRIESKPTEFQQEVLSQPYEVTERAITLRNALKSPVGRFAVWSNVFANAALNALSDNEEASAWGIQELADMQYALGEHYGATAKVPSTKEGVDELVRVINAHVSVLDSYPEDNIFEWQAAASYAAFDLSCTYLNHE